MEEGQLKDFAVSSVRDKILVYERKPKVTTDVTFEEYSRNKILRFAVIKNLEIIGEAAYLITKEFREEHQEIAWNEVIGMRHVLVHGYYQIRDEIVWGTIQTDLFPLKDKIERLICK